MRREVTPKPREHVMANKRDAGRVTVHSWRRQLWSQVNFGELTDCKRRPDWSMRSWMWLEYRTLNPERVVLCKECWGGR